MKQHIIKISILVKKMKLAFYIINCQNLLLAHFFDRICASRPEVTGRSIFPNNTELVEADIYKSGIFLGCQFGMPALFGKNR